MQRYFSIDKNLTLSDKDKHHIINVMRCKIGDQIEIIYDQKVNVCEITELTKKEVKFNVIKTFEENNELDKDVTICFSLVSENKIDFILQKCTELGAKEFIPTKTCRCKNTVNDKKNDRWNLITKEASEQSFRSVCPRVNNIMDLKKIVELDYDLKILCSTKEKEKTIKNVLQNNKDCDRIILVVGPEGGISEEEEMFLNEHGFISSSFGNNILRTETAPIYIMSAIKYEFGR